MKDLFRKEALESFSSEEGLASGVRAINVKIKVFTIVMTFAVIVFCTWLIFGIVHETLTVSGVLWPSKGDGSIYVSNSGIAEKITVKVGDEVEAGDVVAIIPQKQILEKIKQAKAAGASQEIINALYQEYDKTSVFRASLSGIIMEIVPENTFIKDGDKLATIIPYEKDKNNKRVTVYIPMRQRGIVKTGMEVQVSPEHAPREEYGYIDAYVSEVGQYPLAGRFIKQTTSANMDLQDDESYVKIEITLMSDSSTTSQLDWSTKKGEDTTVEMGTVCNCNIIIEKCHPYQWIG